MKRFMRLRGRRSAGEYKATLGRPYGTAPRFNCARPALLCVCFAALCASAIPADPVAMTPRPFSGYQPIIDRMPFGAPPPAVAAAVDPALAQNAAQVQADQQKLAQKINMSCVNVTPDGTTAIGFTDLSDKTPVNYYLLVGATGGGWTVVAADYDDEWAQIKKDDITITLKLGKGLIDAPPAYRFEGEKVRRPQRIAAPCIRGCGRMAVKDRKRCRHCQDAEARAIEAIRNRMPIPCA